MASKYDMAGLQRFADYHAKQWWIAARKIFGDKIGVMPLVKINARLTATAGRAFIESNPAYCDFSAYLMSRDSRYFAVDTIPHELAHHIAWRLYRDNGHGRAWKDVALALYGNNNRCHTLGTKAQHEKAKK